MVVKGAAIRVKTKGHNRRLGPHRLSPVILNQIILKNKKTIMIIIINESKN